jgi:hypothetical protein
MAPVHLQAAVGPAQAHTLERPTWPCQPEPTAVATLRGSHPSPAMPTTPTSSSDWTNERLDRLARALLPVVFPDRAPAPAADNVIALASRRPAPPCTD